MEQQQRPHAPSWPGAVVVDGGSAFAEGLVRLLEQAGHPARCVGFHAARRAVAETRAGVVFVDGDADDETIGGLLASLAAEPCSPRAALVVALAAREDHERAAALGLDGCIGRDGELDDVLALVRSGARPQRPRSDGGVGTGLSVRAAAAQRLATLSPREREVLALLVCGFDNGSIAGRLSISVHTVRTHVENVFGKLGVRSRLQAAVRAAEGGFTPVGVAEEVARVG